MRIVFVGIIIMGQQFGLIHTLGHRNNGAFAFQIVEEILHLCFQIEAMPQDQVGAGHGDDVTAGLTIRMRVNAGAHQALNLNLITTDLTGGIGDHTGGGNHLQRRLGPGRQWQCSGQGQCCKKATTNHVRPRFGILLRMNMRTIRN